MKPVASKDSPDNVVCLKMLFNDNDEATEKLEASIFVSRKSNKKNWNGEVATEESKGRSKMEKHTMRE